jgi:hypothetical protein
MMSLGEAQSQERRCEPVEPSETGAPSADPTGQPAKRFLWRVEGCSGVRARLSARRTMQNTAGRLARSKLLVVRYSKAAVALNGTDTF